jgi:hypothetical protein
VFDIDFFRSATRDKCQWLAQMHFSFDYHRHSIIDVIVKYAKRRTVFVQAPLLLTQLAKLLLIVVIIGRRRHFSDIEKKTALNLQGILFILTIHW